MNQAACHAISSITGSSQPSRRPECPHLEINKRKASADSVPPSKRAKYSGSTLRHHPLSQAAYCDVGSNPDSKFAESRASCSTTHSTQPQTRPEDPHLQRQKGKARDTDSSFKNHGKNRARYYGVTVNCDGDLGGRIFNVSPGENNIFQLASTINTSKEDFEEKYFQHRWLGTGSFGSVYGGLRREDLLPVAFKHITPQNVRTEEVICNGRKYTIYLEVALMLMAAGLPGSVGQTAAVSLLDWFLLDSQLILVMEQPAFSCTLQKYIQDKGGCLEEHEAKIILSQLVNASIDLHSKGVFHRSIKPDNILIESSDEQPRLHLVGFGCGGFSSEKLYWSYSGTPAFAPPEWFLHGKYQACPTTVWQLGAVFYSLLSGHGCFATTTFMYRGNQVKHELSENCKTLLDRCLARDPEQRATLQELQCYLALTETSPPPIQGQGQLEQAPAARDSALDELSLENELH